MLLHGFFRREVSETSLGWTPHSMPQPCRTSTGIGPGTMSPTPPSGTATLEIASAADFLFLLWLVGS